MSENKLDELVRGAREWQIHLEKLQNYSREMSDTSNYGIHGSAFLLIELLAVEVKKLRAELETPR